MALTQRQAAVAQTLLEMEGMSWAYTDEVLGMARGIKAAMDAAPSVEGVLVAHESAMRALRQQYAMPVRVAVGGLFFIVGLGTAAAVRKARGR